MAYAIRAMTVERGYDPREFAMLAYGGGGGLFARRRSPTELEIPTAIVPRAPARLLRLGAAVRRLPRGRLADARRALSTTDATADSSSSLRRRSHARGRRRSLRAHGLRAEAPSSVGAAPTCASPGQEHTLTVPVAAGAPTPATARAAPPSASPRATARLRPGDESRPLEVVTLRATAIGARRTPTSTPARTATAARRAAARDAARVVQRRRRPVDDGDLARDGPRAPARGSTARP